MNKILATLFAFGMLMAIYSPAIMAQPITIGAVVGSRGTPPVINYQFALSLNGGSIVPGDDNPPYNDAITDVRPIPGDGVLENQKFFSEICGSF